MESFTSTDKSVITFLATRKSYHVSFMDICEGIGFIVNVRTAGDDGTMRILLSRANPDKNAVKLIEIIRSVQKLEEKNLILTLAVEDVVRDKAFKSYEGDREVTNKSEFFWQMNNQLHMPLEEIIRKKYYATEELLAINDNKFLSIEQKALSAAQWANWIALVIAVITLISSNIKCGISAACGQ